MSKTVMGFKIEQISSKTNTKGEESGNKEEFWSLT